MADDGQAQPSVETTPFALPRHAKYFLRFLQSMPSVVQSQDANRMSFVFFCLSALDLTGEIDKLSVETRAQYIDWIYSMQVLPDSENPAVNAGLLGFRGGASLGGAFNPSTAPEKARPEDRGHLAMTYTALASLAILGDDFSRVNRDGIALSLRAYQQPDGSFMCAADALERDMRFVFCACSIAAMLGDWRGVDQALVVEYIRQSIGYDGGVAQGPGLEGHGGSTFCAVASAHLMGKMDDAFPPAVRSRLLEWLVHRQTDGFQGRPGKPADTCYSFWIGASIAMLGGAALIDTPSEIAFLHTTENTIIGGFGKVPDVTPDPLHSYMALSGLAVIEYPGLQPLFPALNISRRAAARLPGRGKGALTTL